MVLFVVFVGLIGAVFGSFIDAVSWRLRTKRNFVTGRSECEHCHHRLGVLDLIPIFSWLMLRGKCRYCKKPITPLAPVIEATMALLFILSYLYWPLGIETWQSVTLLVLWLSYLVMLGILFVYDLRWQLLPDTLVYPLILLGFIDAGLRISLTADASTATYASHVVLGVAAMAGVYALLYLVSRGKWVGLGDVKLAVFMGAVLGWQKTLVVLMLANVIGLLVVAPGLLTRRLTPKSHVPFGPFMIAAFIIVGLFGDAVINWYLTTFVLI
jgi:prepilin signal peptidase PulO-like enzyme (type II secretory pathway)